MGRKVKSTEKNILLKSFLMAMTPYLVVIISTLTNNTKTTGVSSFLPYIVTVSIAFVLPLTGGWQAVLLNQNKNYAIGFLVYMYFVSIIAIKGIYVDQGMVSFPVATVLYIVGFIWYSFTRKHAKS